MPQYFLHHVGSAMASPTESPADDESDEDYGVPDDDLDLHLSPLF